MNNVSQLESLAENDTSAKVKSGGTDYVRTIDLVIYSATASVFILDVLTRTSPFPLVQQLFDVTKEGNYPAWIASVLWFAVAVACAACSHLERKYHHKPFNPRMWGLMVVAFAYASLDDVAHIHERLYLGEIHWQMFYAPLFALVGILGGKLLWSRLSKLKGGRVLLLATVGCYVISLLCESVQQNLSMFDALYRHRFLQKWHLCELTEEVVELLGTAFFISALTRYYSLIWKQKTSP